MSGVASPAAVLVTDQTAQAVTPSGTPPATETPAAKRARPEPVPTPSGEPVVREACANAATILGNLANAASSSENLANASALEELSLALRKSEDRFDALCATNASSFTSIESRLLALETRPTSVTAFAAPLANLTLQVYELEKKLASVSVTNDKTDSDAHVFDDGLAPGTVTVFVRNVLTPGIGAGEFGYLSPESRAALNKREAARWYSILLEAKYSGDATQLALDHICYDRLSAETVRIVIGNAAAFDEFVKRRTDFQHHPILQRLLHDRNRPLTFVTDPKSATKPAPSKPKAKPTPRSIANVPPPPPHNHWQQQLPHRQQFSQQFSQQPHTYQQTYFQPTTYTGSYNHSGY